MTDPPSRLIQGFARPKYPRVNPPSRLVEEVLALPFVEVPARGESAVQAQVQAPFQAKRFCIYADDATKLRVFLYFGATLAGAHSAIEMPAALFADGPASDTAPFVLHCSECGAPTASEAPQCRHCNAPFTWRVSEVAYGTYGIHLNFPPLPPGLYIHARFTNRSDKSIGVDSAFIGIGRHFFQEDHPIVE